MLGSKVFLSEHGFLEELATIGIPESVYFQWKCLIGLDTSNVPKQLLWISDDRVRRQIRRKVREILA